MNIRRNPMNVSLSFPVPWKKDRAARWRAKPSARRPPLALEVLEDRTVLSAVPHALPAVIPVLPSGPGISAAFDLGRSASAGALHASGDVRASVSSDLVLRALLQGASKALSALSK